MSHSTLTLNQAICFSPNCAHGAGIFVGFAKARVKSSIVAKNAPGGDCLFGTPNVPAIGENLDSDGTCDWFTMHNTNPLLLALANYGGPTKTHALAFSSPAINAALDCTDVDGNPVATDQRGFARPQGSTCDLGAYENSFVSFSSTQALLNAIRSLDRTLAARLMAPLHEIFDLLSDENPGNDAAVCGKVTAFLNMVAALERHRDLRGPEVASLRRAADRLQLDLRCVGR